MYLCLSFFKALNQFEWWLKYWACKINDGNPAYAACQVYKRIKSDTIYFLSWNTQAVG